MHDSYLHDSADDIEIVEEQQPTLDDLCKKLQAESDSHFDEVIRTLLARRAEVSRLIENTIEQTKKSSGELDIKLVFPESVPLYEGPILSGVNSVSVASS
eukprot:Phypoly_transcript_28372.p1 GENE.Phypoly_transcript_28372~~Phypoly_transcript_28372.p1  ORF type:complete len:100 (+),score=20.36 Phypoly_transcript_28372:69-368(+)